jgi:BirA family biotin operon repressor/biotin-[acetyl-CoA-carboxylase] ligase
MAAPAKPDRLSTQSVQAGLHTKRIGRILRLFEEVDSTNVVASDLAHRGAEHGTVVVAERQTAGKGRLGRFWFSPAAEGLYCSIVLRPESSASLANRLTWIPLLSAMATARAIEQTTSLSIHLKWPNDIMVHERKLGGLLCESGDRERGWSGGASQPQARDVSYVGYVIVGIGLNVNTPSESFPLDLRDVATSIAIATGRRVDRARLLTALFHEIELAIDSLPTVSDSQLVRSYSSLCATIGRRVRLQLHGNEPLLGRAEGIGPDGSLLVLPDGKQADVVQVRAGEVVHLR